jgi:hypothetical protein
LSSSIAGADKEAAGIAKEEDDEDDKEEEDNDDDETAEAEAATCGTAMAETC